MKEVRILGLATLLALGMTLSAQAQSNDATTSSQDMTQSGDQVTTPTADQDQQMSNPGTVQSTESNDSNTANWKSKDTDVYGQRGDDYSRNPYWYPHQQLDYIESNIAGGN